MPINSMCMVRTYLIFAGFFIAWRGGMRLFWVWPFSYFISTYVAKQLSLFEKIMSVTRGNRETEKAWQSFYIDFTCVIKQFVFCNFLFRVTRHHEPWGGFCRVWWEKLFYVWRYFLLCEEAFWVWDCFFSF